MICVTGQERSSGEFQKRLAELATADLHEVRLDHQERPHECLAVVKRQATRQKILVTCRPQTAGGAYRGTETERFNLLTAALEAGAWAVDVEFDAPSELVRRLLQKERGNIVLSHHLFDPGWDLETLRSLLRSMDKPGVFALKLAAYVEDTADLRPMLSLGRTPPTDKPLVLVPMGRAAVVGRVFYRALGSAWTYVAASGHMATAPGQVTWNEAQTLGLANPGPLLALMGGAQVHDSFGPKIYNRLFRSAGLDHVYLPAETLRFEEALDALLELGLAGAAVTMPHKTAACKRADRLDQDASAAGTANTLVRQTWKGRAVLAGYNTDGPAVTDTLSAFGPLAGRTAVVLGAGGAARAAVFALRKAGTHVIVLGRNTSRAQAIAEALGAEAGPWDSLPRQRFDFLINATPVGLDGIASPVSNPEVLAGKVVMDMVSGPFRTPLVRQASDAGARAAIPGIEMWIRQGLTQLRLWTGKDFTAQEIRNELEPLLAAYLPGAEA